MDKENLKRRVLIVDDEPQIGKVFGLKLRLSGFEVVSTTSGSQAVEMVRAENYDAVLLDMLMPEMSGLEVLSALRSFSQIPVIMFTARHDVFRAAKSMGANDYIAKPLNPDLLVEKLSILLNNGHSPVV